MKNPLFLFACFLFPPLAFALPGVRPSIPDLSGQYVYYKDTTFERESYTGILCYDESTYALRYFAPMTKKKQRAKDIQILFSLDPTKNHVDLTGERIITAITPEDTDIVNYLHDILYELTARRQKAGTFTGKTESRQDYEQFGGRVTLHFDALIPLFNLVSITSANNKAVFSLVTAGQLVSSEDDSFFAFKGMPAVLTDKRHQFKPKKSPASEQTYQKEGTSVAQTVALDAQWKQSMDNLWLLGDNAILVMDVIPRPANADETMLALLTRKMLLGTDHSYPDLSRLSVSTEAGQTKISNVLYKPNTESVTQDFKVLTKLGDGSVGFFTLTVFSGAYTKNKAYFQRILDSYRIEQR
ncbi:MAG: hypothetical protein K2O09_00260 [Treponemataceae bacterium]|nr:hypothetical protein [Treponemataceae bacterium]